MEETKIEEKKEPSMKEMMEKLVQQNDKLIEDKKVKRWKFPFNSRVSPKKANQGWATFQIIRDNREVEFVKAPIEDGTAKIDGFPRIAMADYTLHHKGKPFYIIPCWSMKPFSPVDNIEEAEKDRVLIMGRKLVLSKLEGEIISPKKKMNMGVMGWVILIAVIGGVGWYMMKGGKLF